MCAAGTDRTAVHDDDHVRVLNGADTLCDDKLRGVGDLGAEGLPDLCVGLGVNSRGRVVKNQHLWFFQKRTRNAEPLLLTAGDVCTALLDVSVVFVGELLNEFVGAGKAADTHKLFVARVGVAPAQVFLDCAGEKHVFLQHDGDLIAERLKIIAPHVDTADANGALARVIQTRDELHKAGLGRARAAQDTDSLAGFDVQVDIRQRHAVGVGRVFEADVVKIDAAVRYLVNGVFRVVQVDRLAKYLGNSLDRGGCHGEHDKDH